MGSMSTPEPPLLLDTETAATRTYGVDAQPGATRRLEDLRRRGGGPPYVKHGRKVYYRPQDLEAWIEGEIVKSTADAAARGKNV